MLAKAFSDDHCEKSEAQFDSENKDHAINSAGRDCCPPLCVDELR
jgi:hypothetical protein